ncbi:MAG: PorV/PorQ family protein [Elusimicrobia bacterium]|nr:PorV/PorQ family protein [Elusimicrobiota bacterium]
MKVLKRFILKLFTICAVLGLFSSVVLGEGRVAVPFLNIPVGARFIAMGGAATAIADDSTAMFFNPALMAFQSDNFIDFMHSVYFEDASHSWLSATFGVGQRSAVGLSVQYFSFGRLNHISDAGVPLGTFSPRDYAVSLGFATEVGTRLGCFGVGISARYIHSQIFTTASAFAFDIGIASPIIETGFLYERLFIEDYLVLGAVIRNIGGTIRYNVEDEPLPLMATIGAGYHVDNMLFSFDIGLFDRKDIYFAFGAEYSLDINDVLGMALRIGYNSLASPGFSDIDGLTGFSCGIGFRHGNISFDYAFVPFGGLGNTHRISLTYIFGSRR